MRVVTRSPLGNGCDGFPFFPLLPKPGVLVSGNYSLGRIAPDALSPTAYGPREEER